MQLIDPTHYPAIISGLFSLGGTIFAALVGREVINRKRLQERLQIAQRDIAFLLQVEALHCQKHRDDFHESFKRRIRKEAADKGHVWSGRFTPGRVMASSHDSLFKPSWTTRLLRRNAANQSNQQRAA